MFLSGYLIEKVHRENKYRIRQIILSLKILKQLCPSPRDKMSSTLPTELVCTMHMLLCVNVSARSVMLLSYFTNLCGHCCAVDRICI